MTRVLSTINTHHAHTPAGGSGAKTWAAAGWNPKSHDPKTTKPRGSLDTCSGLCYALVLKCNRRAGAWGSPQDGASRQPDQTGLCLSLRRRPCNLLASRNKAPRSMPGATCRWLSPSPMKLAGRSAGARPQLLARRRQDGSQGGKV